MREIRSSGSVEGVVSNRDPYSDTEIYLPSVKMLKVKADFKSRSKLRALEEVMHEDRRACGPRWH